MITSLRMGSPLPLHIGSLMSVPFHESLGVVMWTYLVEAEPYDIADHADDGDASDGLDVVWLEVVGYDNDNQEQEEKNLKG
jgi:hypothetical protein